MPAKRRAKKTAKRSKRTHTKCVCRRAKVAAPKKRVRTKRTARRTKRKTARRPHIIQ